MLDNISYQQNLFHCISPCFIYCAESSAEKKEKHFNEFYKTVQFMQFMDF